MEINLKQSEIEVALRQYVASQGFNLTGRAVAITFTSGRTANGLTALVDIGDVTEVVAQDPPTLTARSAELRASDVQLQGAAVGQAFNAVEPEPAAQEAGEVGESPATTAPDPVDAGAAPVSLFAKPQSN